jgi:hypothetical protein
LTENTPNFVLRADVLDWGNGVITLLEEELAGLRRTVDNLTLQSKGGTEGECIGLALDPSLKYQYEQCMKPTYNALGQNAVELGPTVRELSALIARYKAVIEPAD